MNYEDFTEEQKAQFRAAKTPEEILDLARKNGIELSIEELDEVSGGHAWNECPKDTCSGPY